jgi:hypothetical protein
MSSFAWSAALNPGSETAGSGGVASRKTSRQDRSVWRTQKEEVESLKSAIGSGSASWGGRSGSGSSGASGELRELGGRRNGAGMAADPNRLSAERGRL